MSRVIDTGIPGLTVDFSQHGSYLYATLKHKESGLIAWNFDRAPLPFGKREFVRRLDASPIASIDWTRPVQEFTGPELYATVSGGARSILDRGAHNK